ncbi:hypothetical protein [Streptomyces sp. NPDC088725]|uniref:hypothetical protein n=1 Tax=Streptomyces sp. NPDC088725 TaxID=3365873 RepID=UPI00380EABB3
MGWDEWEQLKAEAAEKRSTRMELNQAPDPGGYAGEYEGDLKVNQSDLAAVGNAAFELHGKLSRLGGHAHASSVSAGSGLRNESFAIGGALEHVAERWDEQVQSLLDACGHISNHLDYTKNAHTGDEVFIGGTFSSISQLDRGFDESAGDGVNDGAAK